MPWKKTWVEPEVFLSYKGVTIYHVYDDDEMDDKPKEWTFGYRKECSYDGTFAFDFESLPGFTGDEDKDEELQAVMRKAIDDGILTQDGLKE